MRTDFVQAPRMEGLKSEFPVNQKVQGKSSFGENFKKTLEQIEGLQKESADAMAKAANGGAEQIHETMIKLEESELSMRLLLKVRTKVLDAYQEVMRMQF